MSRNRATTPWVSLGAGGVVVIAWLVSLGRGADPWAPTAEDLIRAGGSGGEGARAVWRLATAWTVHAGVIHLGFDLCLLMLVGPALERRAGHRVAAITLFGGAVAAAAVSRWSSPYVLSVGASGAAFALAAGLAVWLVRERVRRDPGRPRRWAVLGLSGFAAANLIAAIAAPAIDHAAHVGGAIAGAAVGAMIEIRRVGVGLAALAVLGLTIAMAVAAPVPRPIGPTLAAIDALEVRYRALIAERAAGPRTDRDADASLARAIEADVARPLAELAARLRDDPAMPGRLRTRLAAARRYLAARSDGLELYVRYLEGGDSALRDEIVQTDHAAAAALEELRRAR